MKIAQVCIIAAAVSITSGYCRPSSARVRGSLLEENQQPPATGWKIKFDESSSKPVIADGVLYVGSADGAVYALDASSAETKWRFQTGDSLSPATSSPQIITIPRGSTFNDQINAAIIGSETNGVRRIRRVDMTPVVENGTVFVGAGDQSFYAIDATTGKKKWSYPAGPGMASRNYSRINIAPTILQGGTVYFMTEVGLHALDALTGHRKWLFETLKEIPIEKLTKGRNRVPSGYVMGNGMSFLTAGPILLNETPLRSFVYAIDTASGKKKWDMSVVGVDISVPVTEKGLVFFAVQELKNQLSMMVERVTLYAVGVADGQVKWKCSAEKKYRIKSLLIVADKVYLSTETSLLAVDMESGKHLWSFTGDDISGKLLTDGQHIYVVTNKGPSTRPKRELHALALSTGQEKWLRKTDVDLAMIVGSVVYAGGNRLHAIDADTGKELWSFSGSNRVSFGQISGGTIFLTSQTLSYIGMSRVDQGYLYCIDAKTGKLK